MILSSAIKIAKHRYFPYGLLVVGVIVVYMIWPRTVRPDKEYKADQAHLQTIEKLIQANIELHKASIEAKDQTISVLQSQYQQLKDERKQSDAYYEQIKTKGNEKINRVDSYTVPDIERYMSRFDSENSR